MEERKTIAVDFDGTLCEDRFPAIGPPIWSMIDTIRAFAETGHRLILWTCRRDERLAEAVEWCRDLGIQFDAVNANLPENIQKYGGDTRKVAADLYIDDKNIMPEGILKGDWRNAVHGRKI